MWGSSEGRPYLVMELLRGETLKQYLAKVGGPLSADEVIAFSVQAASALTAAHARGIIHRDIKPANLFVHELGRKRQIKVLDFGLAKKQGDVATADSRTFDGARDLDATATGGGLSATSAGLTSAGLGPQDLTNPGSDGGDGGVYVSRAGEGCTAGCADGFVFARRGDLRDGYGAEGVCRRVNGGGFCGTAERESGGGEFGESGDAGGAGCGWLRSCWRRTKQERYASAEELQEDLEALDVGRVRVRLARAAWREWRGVRVRGGQFGERC